MIHAPVSCSVHPTVRSIPAAGLSRFLLRATVRAKVIPRRSHDSQHHSSDRSRTPLPRVAGNRESHYRDVALGSTLVHFLGLQKPQAVNALTARIEAELPDMCGHGRTP